MCGSQRWLSVVCVSRTPSYQRAAPRRAPASGRWPAARPAVCCQSAGEGMESGTCAHGALSLGGATHRAVR
ncbi:hypothetical protein EMIHUDRAFT_365822, partial [Emiliania huxleyi CCMP1516]|uniref:Uncharacterized protein n=2 Tax=Emiliania huxleyi TaxID=2903 RepID=A0A0D3K1C1_EMIH1